MIELLVRNRWVEIPGATATRTRANAWSVRVPREPVRHVKRPIDADLLDGAALCIDGVESMQVVVEGEDAHAVHLVVLLEA